MRIRFFYYSDTNAIPSHIARDIIAVFGFNVLVDYGGKNAFLPQTFGIFAAIQFLGLLATIWLIPESKGLDLDSFEDDEKERRENRTEEQVTVGESSIDL